MPVRLLLAGISIHVPLAGDDGLGNPVRYNPPISIHVPLAGDDPTQCNFAPRSADFYPRPPCGGRHLDTVAVVDGLPISIHVPLAGDDCTC